MKGRFEAPKPKKQKKPIWKILLIVIAVLLVAIIIGVVALYHSVVGKVNQVQVAPIVYTTAPTEAATEDAQDTTAETEETEVPTTAPHVKSSADYINFLVVGQAARDGESERFADSAIVVTVNTYEKTLTMTSLLRDSFVKMPDYKGHTGGRIKLTTIYHLGYMYGDGIAGSMELMNQTLYDNFGIEIDHNIEIDFDAFIKVIDMLGGIPIYLTEAEADYLNADDFWVYYDVQPGWAHLDGMAALSYVRMRKDSDAKESDIKRTSRQRQFIEAVLGQLKGKSVSELTDIANEVLPLISTSMSTSQITDCLLTFLPMLSDLTIESGGTCPAESQGDMVDIYGDGVYHSVLRFNVENTKKAMRAITEGEE